MKIKVAVIEKDQNYLNRITTALISKYSDKIEVYSFTDSGIASASMRNVSIVLAYEGCDVESLQLSPNCSFAYLTEQIGVGRIGDYPAISKFQKLESIYKQILNVYSENPTGLAGTGIADGNATKIIAFMSPCGGVGTSTCAAACAMHFAAQGKKTLYLNLETFGTASTFFEGQGQYSMSDIVLALKSRKANLQMKIESCVSKDNSGVEFFFETAVALDQVEMESGDIIRLLSELKQAGQYDCVVVDMEFLLDRDIVRLYSQMDSVVWVSNGSDVAERKMDRAYACIETIDKIDRQARIGDIGLLYNKGVKPNPSFEQHRGFRVIGYLPRYKGVNSRQIAAVLAADGCFDTI